MFSDPDVSAHINMALDHGAAANFGAFLDDGKRFHGHVPADLGAFGNEGLRGNGFTVAPRREEIGKDMRPRQLGIGHLDQRFGGGADRGGNDQTSNIGCFELAKAFFILDKSHEARTGGFHVGNAGNHGLGVTDDLSLDA